MVKTLVQYFIRLKQELLAFQCIWEGTNFWHFSCQWVRKPWLKINTTMEQSTSNCGWHRKRRWTKTKLRNFAVTRHPGECCNQKMRARQHCSFMCYVWDAIINQDVTGFCLCCVWGPCFWDGQNHCIIWEQNTTVMCCFVMRNRNLTKAQCFSLNNSHNTNTESLCFARSSWQHGWQRMALVQHWNNDYGFIMHWCHYQKQDYQWLMSSFFQF